VQQIIHIIQIAIAPVFLITGVAAILGVLSNRLGRVIDRARSLELQLESADARHIARVHDELETLTLRAKLIYRALALGTVCALCVCTLIATVFASALLEINITIVVALLFIAAMLALFAALLIFLREVFLATHSLRIGPH
jgi:hypothetical protein